MNSLEAIYEDLKNPVHYKKAVKKRIAKIILGSSVIRAFVAKTKSGLLDCLINLDLEALETITTETEYDKWHYRKVTSVYNCLLKTNNTRFKGYYQGLKWGHATKIFNLFIGHLYFYSPYFEKEKRRMKIHRFLHMPLDSKVFIVLKQQKINVPKSLKTVDAAFYRQIQNKLRVAAKRKKVDPLRFDEYAWTMD